MCFRISTTQGVDQVDAGIQPAGCQINLQATLGQHIGLRAQHVHAPCQTSLETSLHCFINVQNRPRTGLLLYLLAFNGAHH